MSYLARRSRHAINIWPGFVDALATLVLVFIFMLVVFIFAQFGLSDALNKRSNAVETLENKAAILNDELDNQKNLNTDLQKALTDLEQQRQNQIEKLQSELTAINDQRNQLELYSDQLTEKLAESRADTARVIDQKTVLEGQLSLAQRQEEKTDEQTAALSKRLAVQTNNLNQLSSEWQESQLLQKALQTRLQVATVQVSQQANIEEEIDRIGREKLEQSNKAIQLEKEIAELSKSLNISITQLNEKEEEILLLKHAARENSQPDDQTFSGYRSEFFTKLREVLGNHPDIRVADDRFLFQSELLFTSASADLAKDGEKQLDRVAETLLDIAEKMPPDVNWVLQVNGHTDKRPINTPRFPSNWELSTERALSIVRYLIKKGIAPNRLAATGFAEFDPIDTADNLQAYSRNRRIELKFTNR